MTGNPIIAAAPRRRNEQAHARAVQSEVTDMVKLLSDTLSKPLVAVIIGRDAKTVGRWAANANRPGDGGRAYPGGAGCRSDIRE